MVRQGELCSHRSAHFFLLLCVSFFRFTSSRISFVATFSEYNFLRFSRFLYSESYGVKVVQILFASERNGGLSHMACVRCALAHAKNKRGEVKLNGSGVANVRYRPST